MATIQPGPSARPRKPRKLAAVVRVSRVGKRKGENFISPRLQLDGMHEWVEQQQGEDVLPPELIFEELDVSGGRPLAQRPGLSRALELVEAGEVEGIIGIRLDRI